jgi:hypothetical protein
MTRNPILEYEKEAIGRCTMAIPPKQVAKELTEMMNRMVDDVASILSVGEKVSVRVQFFDCVPFDVEIVGKKSVSQEVKEMEELLRPFNMTIIKGPTEGETP